MVVLYKTRSEYLFSTVDTEALVLWCQGVNSHSAEHAPTATGHYLNNTILVWQFRNDYICQRLL